MIVRTILRRMRSSVSVRHRGAAAVTERGGIVIVDDHRSYSEALAMAVQTLLPADRVRVVDVGPDLLDEIGVADVVLLDWQLIVADGLDLARRLRSGARVDGPAEAPHVIMISGHHTPAFERMARRIGACAAISKTASIAHIVELIHRCRRGEGHVPSPHAEPAAAAGDVLTERQVEVLYLLSLGLDVQQIASRLYLSVATVRSYVRDALRRLDAHSQLEAVAIARRSGLIPVETLPPTLERS
jgi:DNA-binding NarL/FixJ family response regulator